MWVRVRVRFIVRVRVRRSGLLDSVSLMVGVWFKVRGRVWVWVRVWVRGRVEGSGFRV